MPSPLCSDSLPAFSPGCSAWAAGSSSFPLWWRWVSTTTRRSGPRCWRSCRRFSSAVGAKRATATFAGGPRSFWDSRPQSPRKAAWRSRNRVRALRTFAYIRVGILLGELLFEQERDHSDADETWVEALLRDPKTREALHREVRAVAEEIAADPRYADEEPLGPDDAARE